MRRISGRTNRSRRSHKGRHSIRNETGEEIQFSGRKINLEIERVIPSHVGFRGNRDPEFEDFIDDWPLFAQEQDSAEALKALQVSVSSVSPRTQNQQAAEDIQPPQVMAPPPKPVTQAFPRRSWYDDIDEDLLIGTKYAQQVCRPILNNNQSVCALLTIAPKPFQKSHKPRSPTLPGLGLGLDTSGAIRKAENLKYSVEIREKASTMSIQGVGTKKSNIYIAIVEDGEDEAWSGNNPFRALAFQHGAQVKEKSEIVWDGQEEVD
ncbi:hypothetical protein DRE_02817 [Drechslerella stenobrocha 248]|uniref:Uncharacterized protein n=1 Tax=Drechslerella stenobrocha 248 TaxID=1043628 RepID=W7IFJ6_9PEZI|nr:hypothetical protein DRE_02817 [Drechslerella stenobrocha 248]